MATATTYRLTDAAASAGLLRRSYESVLLELADRRGLVLSTTQIADRVRMSPSSIPEICQSLARLGLVGRVGKLGKTFTWVATADGYALAELIREELAGQPPLATVTTLPPPAPAPEPKPEPEPEPLPPAAARPVLVAAHPAGGRVQQEEAIWAWVRDVTRADLAGESHRFVEALHQALAEGGHL